MDIDVKTCAIAESVNESRRTGVGASKPHPNGGQWGLQLSGPRLVFNDAEVTSFGTNPTAKHGLGCRLFSSHGVVDLDIVDDLIHPIGLDGWFCWKKLSGKVAKEVEYDRPDPRFSATSLTNPSVSSVTSFSYTVV